MCAFLNGLIFESFRIIKKMSSEEQKTVAKELENGPLEER